MTTWQFYSSYLRRPNRAGASFVLLHVVLTAWMVAAAWQTEDVKGNVLLLQLPVLPMSMAYDAIGLQGAFVGWDWRYVYLVHLPPLLAFLYWLGASLSWFRRYLRGEDSTHPRR